MLKDYGTDVQKLFLEMMLHDAESFVRVQNIYNPENFDRSLRSTAEFIANHSDEYKTLPTREQIKASTGIALADIPDLNEGHSEWFMAEFEGFTRRAELERAILKSADLLEKGDYDPVEKLIKDAVQISLTKDMGTDYFDDHVKRSPIFPEVPTMAELGFKDYEVDSWYAMFVPAKTPQPIIDTLYKATIKALADPAVKEKLLGQGAEAVGSTPAQLGAIVKSEIVKWKKVTKDAAIKAE